jgi:PEP-CTERM motif
MKKTPRVARIFFLATLAILGSTWGVGPAHADTIGMFTGSWVVQSDFDGASRQDQSIHGLLGFGSTGEVHLSFDGSISDYSSSGTCAPDFRLCTETWSGVFSGGTVSFDGYSTQAGGVYYSFTGTILGGSFSGLLDCDYGGDCLWGNEAMFSFVSTSTMFAPPPPLFPVLNGWSSEGTLRVTSTHGPSSFGTLTMTTTSVPEPGSMTLLGAGIAAVATLRRRRRSGLAVG